MDTLVNGYWLNQDTGNDTPLKLDISITSSYHLYHQPQSAVPPSGGSLQPQLLAGAFLMTHPREPLVGSSSPCQEIMSTYQPSESPGGISTQDPSPGFPLTTHMQVSQNTELHLLLPYVPPTQEASKASFQLPSYIRDNQPLLSCHLTKGLCDSEMPSSSVYQRCLDQGGDNSHARKPVTTTLPLPESNANILACVL